VQRHHALRDPCFAAAPPAERQESSIATISFRDAAAYIAMRRPPMSKPLVVSIPHRLGKAEAVRRLKAGLSSVQSDFKHVFTVQEETWVGDSLTFRISALGQTASGVIDVHEDHVQMQLQLPWLLHQIAAKAQGLIRKRGQLLLEKK
jgi:hypothetical protein